MIPGLRSLIHLVVWLLALAPWPAGCGQPKQDEARAQGSASPRPDAKREEKREESMPAAAATKKDAGASDDGKEREAGKGGAAKTWKRSTNLANTSRLMIGDEESLPLEGMHVRTKVDGFRARVLIDFFFFNPHERQYEGTFSLRLPNGASPWFLVFGQSTWTAKTGPAKDPPTTCLPA